MEGYDYISSKSQEEDTRITKEPVIKQNSDNMALTQRAINDLFKEIRKVKE